MPLPYTTVARFEELALLATDQSVRRVLIMREQYDALSEALMEQGCTVREWQYYWGVEFVVQEMH